MYGVAGVTAGMATAGMGQAGIGVVIIGGGATAGAGLMGGAGGIIRAGTVRHPATIGTTTGKCFRLILQSFEQIFSMNAAAACGLSMPNTSGSATSSRITPTTGAKTLCST